VVVRDAGAKMPPGRQYGALLTAATRYLSDSLQPSEILRRNVESTFNSNSDRYPSFKLGNDFAHDFGSCVVPASFKISVLRNPLLRFIQPSRDHQAWGVPREREPLPSPSSSPHSPGMSVHRVDRK
jgi:hypothetical protein